MNRKLFRLGLASCGVAISILAACGGDAADPVGPPEMTSPNDGAVPDRARLPAPLHPDASCLVTIDTPPLLPSPHVPEGTAITYDSNPPSSGPHYPIWANYQEYDEPIDLPYLVHSMEHGGVLLLYDCGDAGGCPDVVAAMRKIRDEMPSDPACDPSVRVRIVIAPDPALEVPVAAAAWGWTYTAECLDVPTLTAFVHAHYGQGTEAICAPGKMTF